MARNHNCFHSKSGILFQFKVLNWASFIFSDLKIQVWSVAIYIIYTSRSSGRCGQSDHRTDCETKEKSIKSTCALYRHEVKKINRKEMESSEYNTARLEEMRPWYISQLLY